MEPMHLLRNEIRKCVHIMNINIQTHTHNHFEIKGKEFRKILDYR